MNEEEMMRMKKIEKREKTDTILAYILIVILIACLGVILFLKFVKKEDTKPEEHNPTYISINEIVTKFNGSTLISKYNNDGVKLIASKSDNTIVITYTKDNNNTAITIPQMSNELEITLNSDNEELYMDIYKELANIVCTYYGNSEDNCRTTIDKIKSDTQGIRFVTNGDNKYVYIDITKGVDVNASTNTYTEETKVSLDNVSYVLNISDTEIKNIVVDNGDTAIKVSGSIKNLSTDGVLSIIVKLYDNDGNVVGEDKKEYTADKALNGEDTFEFSFTYNDTLKKDNVKDYSINVVR